MLYFINDYSECAHPKIMEKLLETNMEKTTGYGTDPYTLSAKEKIKAACNCPNADVYFLVGGTQTNQIVIDTMCAAYEGVVAADTGHVNVHEAGAIEFSGHKVLTVPSHDGKVKPAEVRNLIDSFYADENHEHMVFPGMVYISHPTELGTLYTKQELSDLHDICAEYDIPLYLDGARLGYGLATPGCDVSLLDIANYCDVFYIGGTKVGAMFGEAVVFTKNNMPKHFVAQIKQHGALLAKGRILGIQFDTLFTDDLYMEISKNAIDTAMRIKQGFSEKGYEFFIESPTNQTFIVLDKDSIASLKDKGIHFDFWENIDEEHVAVRFCTSWATKMEDVEKLLEIM